MGSARPNILMLMVDQLNGTLFPDGPAPFLHVPALARLAERSVRFANAYCASPLCAPSRAAFMTGRLPSRTGVYDNAAEFASAIPTFAHHLRRAGYRTVLCGKMHFVGPDQLHGFEERLTTDIYPADFGWTPDWTKPDERIDWWYHNLGSVLASGTAEATNQLDYDDEVAFLARQRLYDFAREPEARPFCLTVSFTHPHDPYVMRPRYFDLYGHDVPMPAVRALPYEAQDPHSRRLFDMSDWRSYSIGEEDVRRSRRAYFASISYLDERIGELLGILEACRLADDTVILFTSDHGDMLGERGLWFKMSFFEGSVRVPLLLHAPQLFSPRSVATPVSLLDVAPTLVSLAGGDASADRFDGTNLLPLAGGAPEPGRTTFAEYAAEGAVAPVVMVREGEWKYVHTEPDPPLLFDLAADPHEMNNLAADPAHAAVAAGFAAKVRERWDLERFRADVLESQQRRLVVYEALRRGHYYPWDFQPLKAASERYMRNHMDLNVVDAAARFPPAGG